ncbi:TBC1 domain family member 2A isoform X2 [Rhineura floridana]|uniref:TBC1 domain family member 2A isoform X2 n=1 Tax=Rhineura floridana TaxID=261503 RepID=UPI002AC82846|nr:TBC1 domain family member 2A isoform X2 [Rhineura floridana]
MEADSESRDCLVAGTSSKSEEGKAVLDTGSSKDCAIEGDGPPCPEDWENVSLKHGKETHKKQLCGYLNKFSAKAPIKAWKSRWFFYDKNKCHLLYYRTAHDVNPLGSIEISSASFDLKVGADEGVFEIRTPSKEFILKAVNKPTMMYWLQQLQIKRWEFCNNQPRSFVEDDTDFPPPVNEAELDNAKTEHEFLPPVKTPTDVVGIEADPLRAPQQPSVALQNISLKHPWIEIQNKVHSLCGSRWNKRDNGGVSGFERIQDDLENVADEEHLQAEVGDTVTAELQKDTRMTLKAALVRKNKKTNSSFHRFVEGTGEEKASLQHQVLVLAEEIKSQKDDLEAYKTQNQFLNSEIHQVTKIWSTVAQREKTLLMKCARLQAHNCQIESKYLMILRKLQGLPDLASEHVEMLKGLIQEALQWDVKEEAVIPIQLSPINQYDDYGFVTVPECDAADWKLLAKIQALEIKSSNLLNHEGMERPLFDRWNNLGELTPSSELKSLLRCGVPAEHRQRVWRWIVSRRVQHIHSPGHYQNLLKKCEVAEHPASRQIELDLPRTLTNNRHFMSPASPLLPKLRRVLLAFSWQNPTIGYCQGLNRLAAIALLVLEEEENAFWCLVHITENLMPPDYYSNTLIGSQVDQRVFKDFLLEKLPRLTAHLEQHRIDLGLVTFNWFLVIFVDSLVSDILFRVWDAFLYEGTKVIFRYALAIFKYNEEAILRIQDSLEIYQYFRCFTKTICDGRKLMNIAFSDMNPFPMKVLQNRRSVYRLKLESEMTELEQIKAQYAKKQAEHADSNPNGAVSEDEEEM